MSDSRRYRDEGRQYNRENRLSGYGDQGYQRGVTEDVYLNNYSPRYTPPPTRADYGTPGGMAVQYKDPSNGSKDKQPFSPTSYVGPSSGQAYYNPQIQASAYGRQDVTSVVITGDAPKGPPPMDYYRTSIFLTFACFFPLGIACWRKSIRCREAIERGDYERARAISAELKTYTEVTLGLGWFLYVIIIVILVVVLSIVFEDEIQSSA